jgi:hypothetical protein
MQISARNSLKGKVKSIEDGAVNTQVIIAPFKRRGNRLNYHERFGGTLAFSDRLNGLCRRQSERRDDCDRLILVRKS